MARRLALIGFILLASPVCAEYLQAYLPWTGEGWRMLASLSVLGPLYGGAAILVREVGVRTSRGWSGRLLLAAAFGLTMTGLVDLSLVTKSYPGIPYWEELRAGTLLGAVPVYALVTWPLGHVLYSVGAPLALADALEPNERHRPLLGRVGLTVIALLFLAAACLVHADTRSPENLPTATQLAFVVAGIVALIALALSPLGRPWAVRTERGAPRPRWLLVGALPVALAVEMTPWTWLGTGMLVAGLVLIAFVVRTLSARTGWSVRHVSALAAAGLIARTLLGFVSPKADGVSQAAAMAQSLVLLGLVLVVARWAWVRSARAEGALAVTDVGR